MKGHEITLIPTQSTNIGSVIHNGIWHTLSVALVWIGWLADILFFVCSDQDLVNFVLIFVIFICHVQPLLLISGSRIEDSSIYFIVYRAMIMRHHGHAWSIPGKIIPKYAKVSKNGTTFRMSRLLKFRFTTRTVPNRNGVEIWIIVTSL